MARILLTASVLGTTWFGLTILLLSALTTVYNPVAEMASDYGVGSFATEMNLGFFVGGIGLIAFGLDAVRVSKVGGAILTLDGLVLIMDSYFHTSIEGTPQTLNSTIHGFGGAIFFFTAPFGILFVARRFGRSRLLITLSAVILGILFEIVNSVLSFNAGGLAERLVLLVIFTSVVTSSFSLLSRERD